MYLLVTGNFLVKSAFAISKSIFNKVTLFIRAFFDVCGGIFLNYTWDDGNLVRSSALGRDSKRPYDVYVGVDVFGRGCRGGGGFSTKEVRDTYLYQYQYTLNVIDRK